MGRSNENGGVGEIYEAFAAIAIAVTTDLGLSPDVVNVGGGPIAHGVMTFCIGGG